MHSDSFLEMCMMPFMPYAESETTWPIAQSHLSL